MGPTELGSRWLALALLTLISEKKLRLFCPVLCRAPGLGLAGKVQDTRMRENNEGNVLMYMSEIAHVEWLAVCLNFKLTWCHGF